MNFSFTTFERYLRAVAILIFYFFIIVLLTKFFIFDIGKVEGISMEPTWQNGETFAVNKFIFLLKPPQRGEVVEVIEPDNKKLLIKRIIGLPGESVLFQGDEVYIQPDANSSTTILLSEPYISFEVSASSTNNPDEIVTFPVGLNQYFVMGDNRAHSIDSRSYGPVHRSDIVGRVE